MQWMGYILFDEASQSEGRSQLSYQSAVSMCATSLAPITPWEPDKRVEAVHIQGGALWGKPYMNA